MVALSALKVLYRNLFPLSVDVSYFSKDPDVDIVPVPELLWGGHEKLVSILDNLADIIRQPAIGKRDILSSLKEDDLGMLIEPARPGCGSSAAGHTPDDQQLRCHDMLLAAKENARKYLHPIRLRDPETVRDLLNEPCEV
jgi:hypothetical protein